MAVQLKKIEVEKWCEGERRHADPGTGYVLDWILENGGWFRKSWDRSCCRHCLLLEQCGYEVKETCESFLKKSKE